MPSFRRLQRTYTACLAFAGIMLSTTLVEVVLAAHEGDPLQVALRTVALIGAAFALAAVAGLVAAPILDRYADVRLGKTGALKALALGTLCAVPILINKLGR